MVLLPFLASSGAVSDAMVGVRLMTVEVMNVISDHYPTHPRYGLDLERARDKSLPSPHLLLTSSHFFTSHAPSNPRVNHPYSETTMPKVVAPSTSSSTRRRSTRSPAPPSSSASSDNHRSAEMTAYQLLRSQLEKEEWRLLSNRKGGFVLVKKGFTIDDAGE